MSVALCGPDGVGKSTIASALEDSLPGDTLHLHHKPGLLPSPGTGEGGDFTRPHAREQRSRATSLLKVLFLFVDWWLGWIFSIWPRVRRGDSVVIQRPWVDMAVDPKRYRLDVPAGLVRLLGRLLPDPDLTILLTAPVEVIRSRKDELSTGELEASSERWAETIASVRRSVVVDVSGDLDTTLQSVLSAIEGSRMEHGMHFSHQDGRWVLPRHPRKAAITGIGIYHPMNRRSEVFAAAARVGAGLGLTRLMPAAAVPTELREAVRPWISEGKTYAARRLRRGQRWFVLLIDRGGNPELALKIGLSPSARSAIEAEKETIRLLAPVVESPLATPDLVDATFGILAMEPVVRRPRRDVVELPPAVAASLGALFRSTGDESKGRVHGDLAPWNLLWDSHRWVLVDWESSTDNGRPFHDVFHWIVQSHSLLMRPSSEEIVAGLVSGTGPVGEAVAAFASAAGVDPSVAPAEFGAYLRDSEPWDDTSRTRLERAVSRRRRLAERWSGAYAPDST